MKGKAITLRKRERSKNIRKALNGSKMTGYKENLRCAIFVY
jgi:hypothetical protein